MSTRFCGRITGFNPKGDNEAVPNEMGPPATKFGGRPAVPAGPLKRYPGAVADISSGNRRLAKAKHGEGEDGGVSWGGHATGFNGKSVSKKGSKAYEKGGGKGSGFRKDGTYRK